MSDDTITATVSTDPSAPDFAAPTFECAAGAVTGWIDDDVIRATGIRYARAERFGVPTPEPVATEPIDATSWSPACPQSPDPLAPLLGDCLAGLTVDENCQYLSVTVPADMEPGETLPVMVWVHGGSYAFGAGDSPIYDPAPLVVSQRVVAVNITYRLAIFGFLGGAKRLANLGLLDLIEGFRWVNSNIAAFGGDVDNITAFGESAGADAIAHLMIADGAEGLFQRAIIQSPPLGISRGRAPMATSMYIAAGEADLMVPFDDIVGAEATVAASAQAFGLKGAMPFGPQYGYAPLPPESRVDAAWEAAAAKIDILIGSTSREAALFVPRIPKFAKLPDIPVIGGVVTEAVIRAATWLVYGAGVKKFAKRHRKAGGTAATYTLYWGPPGSPLVAAHGTDIPLLLGRWSYWKDAPIVEGVEAETILDSRAQVQAIWGEFARTGTVVEVEIPDLITTRTS